MKSNSDLDVEYLADNLKILHGLKGKTVLVTGATGLIGSSIVKTLCEYDLKWSIGLHVIALVRNQDKAKKLFEPYLSNSALKFVLGDVNKNINVEEKIDYIIHGASVTSSQKFVECPVETINTLISGTNNVLELARKNKTKKFVFLSSLEVYGIPDEDYQIDETFVGYLDFSNVRSSYSEGKRLAECLCYSYAKQYTMNVSTARLAQTFGPGVDYNDNRVFAQFARCVLNKNNIVLHTNGNTYRNYCYLRDAVAGILYILLNGENCAAYNIANKETGITISDLAQLVCKSPKLGNGEIKVVYEVPKEIERFGYNPEMKIELLTNRLEQLGWVAEVGLEEMFVRMIEDMRENK